MPVNLLTWISSAWVFRSRPFTTSDTTKSKDAVSCTFVFLISKSFDHRTLVPLLHKPTFKSHKPTFKSHLFFLKMVCTPNAAAHLTLNMRMSVLWQCSDLLCPVDLAQAASHPEPERCSCPAAELRLPAGWLCSLSVAPYAACSCCADSYIAGMTTCRVQLGHLENKYRDDYEKKTKMHLQHQFCCTHRWHKLLDDLVELFCVGRSVGAAADIQSKFTQRKNISSGIPTRWLCI